MRRLAVRSGRLIAHHAGALLIFMVAGSTGFVLVAAYLMANP
ncbi:hypothetical protein ACFU6R_12480 [Streptomyces sp. NPDC057499]